MVKLAVRQDWLNSAFSISKIRFDRNRACIKLMTFPTKHCHHFLWNYRHAKAIISLWLEIIQTLQMHCTSSKKLLLECSMFSIREHVRRLLSMSDKSRRPVAFSWRDWFFTFTFLPPLSNGRHVCTQKRRVGWCGCRRWCCCCCYCSCVYLRNWNVACVATGHT